MATCSIVRTFNSARSQLRVFVHSLAIQNTANPISDSDNGAKTCPRNAHNPRCAGCTRKRPMITGAKVSEKTDSVKRRYKNGTNWEGAL